jgi:hypothetical protein
VPIHDRIRESINIMNRKQWIHLFAKNPSKIDIFLEVPAMVGCGPADPPKI